MTERDYQRQASDLCDPPWTWRLLALAIAAVVVIGLAVSEWSL